MPLQRKDIPVKNPFVSCIVKDSFLIGEQLQIGFFSSSNSALSLNCTYHGRTSQAAVEVPIEGETGELAPHPEDQCLCHTLTGEGSFVRLDTIFQQRTKQIIQMREESCRGCGQALVQLLKREHLYTMRVLKETDCWRATTKKGPG